MKNFRANFAKYVVCIGSVSLLCSCVRDIDYRKQWEEEEARQQAEQERKKEENHWIDDLNNPNIVHGPNDNLDNADYQYRIAYEYYCHGNYPKALIWFEKSAKQGYAKSQFMLGEMYHNAACVGGFSDNVKAFYWYKKAVNQGVAEACERIAWFYYYGDPEVGVVKNRHKAWEYGVKAQDGGADATYLLKQIRKEVQEEILKAQQKREEEDISKYLKTRNY